MSNEPSDIHQSRIINNSWSTYAIGSFLRKLPKGTIFGYSHAFSLEQILDIAEKYGVELAPLTPSSTYTKKYGDYVLRISQAYLPDASKVRVVFHYHHIDLKKSLGARKCRGDGCTNVINKDDMVFEASVLTSVPFKASMAYQKQSLCTECGAKVLKSKMKSILNLMPWNKRKIKQIEDLLENL
jgi:hypothetical protein